MAAHYMERERALRHLADLCARNQTSGGRLRLSDGCVEAPHCGSESSDAERSSSCDLSASSSCAPLGSPSAASSPHTPMGSPAAKRPPLVRPTEIKRRNRKRQVPGETQTDLRRLAKRAKARQNAQLRLQAILGADMYCHACGTTETPEWRKGPDGQKSLCNACGLHFAKIVRTERERQEAGVAAPPKPQTTRIAVTALLN